MLIGGRAALFLIVTLALGPGILTNVIFKEHWGRMRPVDVTQFGGADRFTPWWDPARPLSGKLLVHCRRAFRRVLDAGARRAGAAAMAAARLRRGARLRRRVGVLRMAAGGHFFTDVVFAGVFMFLLVWVVHGLIYRWRPTRLTDKAIERPLERAGERSATRWRRWRGGFGAQEPARLRPDDANAPPARPACVAAAHAYSPRGFRATSSLHAGFSNGQG